jgi:acetyl-CoA C-acetyltransferase
MIHEGLTCAMGRCHMGMTAEEIVERFGVSREDQDAFAAESQRGPRRRSPRRLRDEIVPVEIPQRKGRRCASKDEYPRAGTTAEKLAR